MVKTNSETNANQQAIKKFSDFLEAKRLRKTPEREAVLECITAINKHFTVEELNELMEKQNYRLSRATLYNTIDLLLECNILRKNLFDGMKPQYEMFSDIPHSHLVCTSCGKVKELRDNNVSAFMNARKYTAFTRSYYTITVYGTCSTCMRRRKRQASISKR